MLEGREHEERGDPREIWITKNILSFYCVNLIIVVKFGASIQIEHKPKTSLRGLSLVKRSDLSIKLIIF